MAHSLSAKKRIRQNAKRRARNRWRKTTMKSAIKDFLAKLANGSVDDAAKAFQHCARVIDRTAAKGVIHRNQAARRKSRLSARLKAKKLGAAPAAA
jgi:small subunit ribosomal protein S20